MNKYIVDTKWDLDDNGDLQLRERELWTLFTDDYFSDQSIFIYIPSM